MQTLDATTTDVAPSASFPREIPPPCWAAVRAYMTDDGLLAPVGHPLKAFRVPCPKSSETDQEHFCHMARYESRFECTCGAEGDYWHYVALLRVITPKEAYDWVLARLEVAALSELRYPCEGQRYYDKNMAHLLQVPTWVTL